MSNYSEIVVFDLNENIIGGYRDGERLENYTDEEIVNHYIEKFGEEIIVNREFYEDNLFIKSESLYDYTDL